MIRIENFQPPNGYTAPVDAQLIAQTNAQISTQINALIAIFMQELPARLPANLVGLYLRGSLLMGDFRPTTSDIDLLAVTYQRVSDTEYARLAELHAQLSQSDHPFARRIEIAYIDRNALRCFQPGQRFPTLGQGETLAWSEHFANWILERWMVREHGIALFGPLPLTLIEPIARQEVIDATRDRLQNWVAWAGDTTHAEWQGSRGHKAYVVETMCRVLNTLETGEIRSKPQAVAWAQQTLPEPWATLVAASQSWHGDNRPDPTLIVPVRDFILWVAARSQERHGE